MAARRSRNDRRPSLDWAEWRDMMPALALLGLVVGILVLTALLRAPAGDVTYTATDRNVPARPIGLDATDDPREETPSIARSIEDPEPEPDGSPEPTSALPADLETRALVDRARLRARGDGYTLQVLMACDPANVRKLIERLGNDGSLYVLPLDHQGRQCYRACWGTFPDRDRAVADRSLPADLLREIGAPTPKEISLVTP